MVISEKVTTKNNQKAVTFVTFDITSIQYNSLNLPQAIEVASPGVKGRVKYTYSVAGIKLRTVHETDMDVQAATIMAVGPFATETTNIRTTDYVGNKVYENNVLKRILVDGGYIEGNTYHFYQTDHLGNNRGVAKADGTQVQKTHYYPFGSSFAVASGTSTQPYRYNGKELDQMHELNLYDYSARYYESSIGRFTTVDPLAEKYYSISPYVYCLNNPLKYIDPTGMYSTEEWKRDNGVTDDDLYTVYQSPQDGDPDKNKSNSSSPISILGNIKKSFSALGNFNISSTIGEFAMNLFSIKESVTTSDGEKYDKYIKRTYENSAPDYLGGNIGVNAYLFVPVLSQGVDFNIGYVKNDGWVIFPTHRSGTGFDISVTGGITWGVYTGNKAPIAKTIGGSGYSVSLGSGNFSVSGSQDITLGIGGGIGKQWNMFSVNASLGTPVSGQISLTETFTPRYLRDFKW